MKIGVTSIGIKLPLIREGDNLEDIIYDSTKDFSVLSRPEFNRRLEKEFKKGPLSRR